MQRISKKPEKYTISKADRSQTEMEALRSITITLLKDVEFMFRLVFAGIILLLSASKLLLMNN